MTQNQLFNQAIAQKLAKNVLEDMNKFLMGLSFLINQNVNRALQETQSRSESTESQLKTNQRNILGATTLSGALSLLVLLEVVLTKNLAFLSHTLSNHSLSVVTISATTVVLIASMYLSKKFLNQRHILRASLNNLFSRAQNTEDFRRQDMDLLRNSSTAFNPNLSQEIKQKSQVYNNLLKLILSPLLTNNNSLLISTTSISNILDLNDSTPLVTQKITDLKTKIYHSTYQGQAAAFSPSVPTTLDLLIEKTSDINDSPRFTPKFTAYTDLEPEFSDVFKVLQTARDSLGQTLFHHLNQRQEVLSENNQWLNTQDHQRILLLLEEYLNYQSEYQPKVQQAFYNLSRKLRAYFYDVEEKLLGPNGSIKTHNLKEQYRIRSKNRSYFRSFFELAGIMAVTLIYYDDPLIIKTLNLSWESMMLGSGTLFFGSLITMIPTSVKYHRTRQQLNSISKTLDARLDLEKTLNDLRENLDFIDIKNKGYSQCNFVFK